MSINGLRASKAGGKKLRAASIIVALILASFSAIGVLAAPSRVEIGGSQLRELQADMRWYNNFRLQPDLIKNSADRSKLQQYLDQYALALRQAQAVVAHGGINTTSTTSTGQGTSSNSQANNSSGQNSGSNAQVGNRYLNNLSTDQQLAVYLHMLRGLQDKISSLGLTNNGMNGSNALSSNNGIPVTGGSTTTSGIQSNSSTTGTQSSGTNTTSQSSGTSSGTQSSGKNTTTQSSGANTGAQSNGTSNTNQASTTTNGNQTIGRNFGLAWGAQGRELVDAIRWYNNYRSQPGRFGNSTNQAKIQQYLDQYASVLRQAMALVIHSTPSATGQASTSSNTQANNTSIQNSTSTNQNNTSIGQFNNQYWRNLSSQQILAMYLHMLRGLQDKIMIGGSTNSTTGG